MLETGQNRHVDQVVVKLVAALQHRLGMQGCTASASVNTPAVIGPRASGVNKPSCKAARTAIGV